MEPLDWLKPPLLANGATLIPDNWNVDDRPPDRRINIPENEAAESLLDAVRMPTI